MNAKNKKYDFNKKLINKKNNPKKPKRKTNFDDSKIDLCSSFSGMILRNA